MSLRDQITAVWDWEGDNHPLRNTRERVSRLWWMAYHHIYDQSRQCWRQSRSVIYAVQNDIADRTKMSEEARGDLRI